MSRRNKSLPSQSHAHVAKRARCSEDGTGGSLELNIGAESSITDSAMTDSAPTETDSEDSVDIVQSSMTSNSRCPVPKQYSLARWVLFRNKAILIPHDHFDTDRQHDPECDCKWCLILNSPDTVPLGMIGDVKFNNIGM